MIIDNEQYEILDKSQDEIIFLLKQENHHFILNIEDDVYKLFEAKEYTRSFSERLINGKFLPRTCWSIGTFPVKSGRKEEII